MLSLVLLLASSANISTSSPCTFLVEVYMTEKYDGTLRKSGKTYDKKLRRSTGKRLAVCKKIEKLVHRGQALGWYTNNPLLPLVVAWRETGFTEKTISDAGAKGPLQVMTHYWCPKHRRCNLIRAGLDALQAYHKRQPTLCKVLAAYNGGSCAKTSNSYAYAQRIIQVLQRLEARQYNILVIKKQVAQLQKNVDRVSKALARLKARNIARQKALAKFLQLLKGRRVEYAQNLR